MGLTHSCLYECRVIHHRLEPVEHRFSYAYFLFGLDLDEIDDACRRLKLLSRRRFSPFSFREEDHVLESGTTLRRSLELYLLEKGVAERPARIFMVGQTRCFGYVFNPVTFFYAYDAHDRPLCAVVEVTNTFHEQKRYFLGPETLGREGFSGIWVKNFYVSPFADLDDFFDFRLGLPSDRLVVRIDDLRSPENEPPFLRTVLAAERRPLTDAELLRQFAKFPFVTLKIMTAIHWQALRLHFKGLPHHKKNENPHLQTEVFHAKHESSIDMLREHRIRPL